MKDNWEIQLSDGAVGYHQGKDKFPLSVFIQERKDYLA